MFRAEGDQRCAKAFCFVVTINAVRRPSASGVGGDEGGGGVIHDQFTPAMLQRFIGGKKR